MSEEYQEEDALEEELLEEGPKEYFRRKKAGVDKAMLVAWGISVASAAVLILLATLIVLSIMEEEEEPIELAIAPTNVQEEQEEKQEQVKKKQMEKSSSSSSMRTPIVTQNISDMAMEAVEFTVDVGDADGGDVGFVGTAMNVDMGDLGGGMNLNLKMPKIMGGRCDKTDRLRRLRREGGKESTEDAVVKGLHWLKTVQNADGSWGEQYKASMTGLSLLSYLGHCEKQDSPDFGDTVMKGIKYLLELNEKQAGKMYTRKPGYETGICAYALAESYIVTKDFRPRIPGIDQALKRSIKIIIERQKEDGGWDYGYSMGMARGSDTSVTGWQIQALKVAKLTGLDFPGLDSCMDKAMKNILRVRGPKGGFGYRDPQDRLGLSGVGVLALQMWDPNKYSKEIKAGVDFIIENETKNEVPKFNKYGWYYHTQACFQAGGRSWDDWNRMFQDEVVEHQDKDGSWKDWGHGGHGPAADSKEGKIYTSTLCILMLEIYYRYLQNTGDDKHRKGATGLKKISLNK